MAITLNGSTGITTPTYGGSVSAEYITPVTGFKNRIINGDMKIDQRNAGASVTPTLPNSTYMVDRFAYSSSQGNKLSFQQVIDAPEGFKYSTKCTIASSYTPLSTDQFEFGTRIEGQNLIDLQYGIATAQTVTLSFWVKGSIAGTYSGAIFNATGTQSYIFTYTVSSTWVKQSITILGSVTGTWATDNSLGMYVSFDLGCGTNLQGASSGSWLSTNSRRVSGTISFVSQTAGATFYITGVQLEKGDTATSFDYRPYGTELALCQRYFEVSYSGAGNFDMVAVYRGASDYRHWWDFKVEKRTTPTIALGSGATWNTGTPTINASVTKCQFNRAGLFNVAATADTISLSASAEL